MIMAKKFDFVQPDGMKSNTWIEKLIRNPVIQTRVRYIIYNDLCDT